MLRASAGEVTVSDEGRITLKEIARRANTSVATVSYALNGTGRLSVATRRHLQSVLRDAGYRPAHLRWPVFYLAHHRVQTDASTVLPMLRCFEGLSAILERQGVPCRLEIIAASTPDALHEHLTELVGRRPGAVIVDTCFGPQVEAIGRFLEQRAIPAVQVGHVEWSDRFDAVTVDNVAGARMAVEHFVRNGHSRIGTIRWNAMGDPASRQKHAGFREAMEAAGLPLTPAYVTETSQIGRHRMDARLAMTRLLSSPEPPTAVFVENTFISVPLIYPASVGEVGPPQYGVDMIHFEAWDLSPMEDVLASTLQYPARRCKLLQIDWEQMGRLAARRVLDRVSGELQHGRSVRVVPQLAELCSDQAVPCEA